MKINKGDRVYNVENVIIDGNPALAFTNCIGSKNDDTTGYHFYCSGADADVWVLDGYLIGEDEDGEAYITKE